MLSIYLDIVIHLLLLKLNMLSFLQIKLGYQISRTTAAAARMMSFLLLCLLFLKLHKSIFARLFLFLQYVGRGTETFY